MTTYTPIARLPIMQPGDVAVRSAWGSIINSAWPCVEQLAAGNTPISLAGLTAYTLTVANDTSDQARQAILPFTGALPGNCTVTLPAVARIGWVSNNTSGGFNVILTAGGTNNLTVPPGASFLYTCDGVSVGAVTLGTSGVLSAGAGVNVPNNLWYSGTSTTNVTVNLLGVDSSNFATLGMASAGWRVLSGATAVLTILPSGAATFSNSLTVQGATLLQGTLGVTGATSLTNLTVTGTASFASPPTFTTGTQSYGNGIDITGYDAGGLNLRFTSGNYGSGFRQDGSNLYLLLTNSGAQSGTFNPLRPLTIDLANGAVTLDGTGAGTYTSGPLAVSGALSVSGGATIGGVSLSGGGLTVTTNVNMGNGSFVYGKDSGGTARPLIGMDTGNYTDVYAGANGLRVFNQAGNTNLLYIDTAGDSYIEGTAYCAAVNATGTVSGASGNFTNATVYGTLYGSMAFGGSPTFTAVANFTGNSSYAYSGAWLDSSGAHTGSFNVGCSIIASHGIGAVGFYASSDGRMKTDITDITPTDAYDWLRRARPRTYWMGGQFCAGFIAQEDLLAGRGDAVRFIPDDDPRFTESDGIAPAGVRLARQYDHDIAYLTAALQAALDRIAALEAKV